MPETKTSFSINCLLMIISMDFKSHLLHGDLLEIIVFYMIYRFFLKKKLNLKFKLRNMCYIFQFNQNSVLDNESYAIP